MSAAPVPPPAFGSCTCECHRDAQVMHMVECCSEADEPIFEISEFSDDESRRGQRCVLERGRGDPGYGKVWVRFEDGTVERVNQVDLVGPVPAAGGRNG